MADPPRLWAFLAAGFGSKELGNVSLGQPLSMEVTFVVDAPNWLETYSLR